MSTALQAVLAVGLGSQGLRALPLLLAGRLHIPPRVALVLRDAGTAALAALLAAAVASANTRRQGGERLLLWLPLIVAVGLALRGWSLARVMAGAVCCYAVALALGWLL
jgi:branched-subunit amino acid transport protein